MSAKKFFLVLAIIYLGVGVIITANFQADSNSIGFKCIDGNTLRNLRPKEKIERAIMATVFWLPLTISNSEGFAFGSHCT